MFYSFDLASQELQRCANACICLYKPSNTSFTRACLQQLKTNAIKPAHLVLNNTGLVTEAVGVYAWCAGSQPGLKQQNQGATESKSQPTPDTSCLIANPDDAKT